jgi:hypothetical protein
MKEAQWEALAEIGKLLLRYILNMKGGSLEIVSSG